MTISLTKEQEALLQHLMESGRYANKESILEDALRLLERYQDKLETLRTDIQGGLDSLDQGLYNEYTAETLPQHLEAIKQRNQSRLTK